MEKRKLNFGSWVISLLVTLLLVLASPVGKSYSGDVDPADKQAFFDALVDTEDATQREISTKLLAVVPWYDTLNDNRLHGSSLKWENPDDPSNSRVLVVAFMDRSGYDKYYKKNLEEGQETYTLTKSLWVTVVPELKNFFIGKECPPTAKRLVKLYGLNPAFEYDVLLEIWVYPKDLFRPSPDPEVTDHEGELSVKIDDDNWTFPSDSNAFLTIDMKILFKDSAYQKKPPEPVPFKTWFMNRAQTIYHRKGDDPGAWGWPWSRLGYTYDWGNPNDHVGLSEFIIRIDPDKPVDPEKPDGVKGAIIVKLERAIDSAKPDEWDNYFRCVAEGTDSSGGSGCFTKTCD